MAGQYDKRMGNAAYSECMPRLAKDFHQNSIQGRFNIVHYDKETTWGGSLKERWGMSYTIGTRN